MEETRREKPITYDELYEKVKKIIKKNEELDVINRAYAFALEKHGEKKRLNGDPYISHPLEVAYILTDLNVDYVTIACALLHETINHTDATIEEIREEFGDEIANIVSSISKINKLELSDDKDSSAQYLRKVLVGLSEDVRVLFIKLADRLHNMRTLYALPVEVQKQKANETTAVLIPIAHRLGINSIKSELEDWCLRYTKPDVYNDILERLDASREELNELLNEMKQSISDILTENGISFKIKGRVKSVHSLYNKMDNGKRFNDIYDILALRVFVDTVQDCYLTIGLIHSKYRPMPRRFKDYIANPKENMYQSLHTTIFGVEGHLFEVQVRTYEMDEIAEKGIASHWSYKEKGSVKIQSMMEHKLEMFRNIIDANSNVESDNEFASNLNDELLSDLIYCYTPKGDVLELPKGATPIDFAYRIHSGVGDRTIGAIVNDQIVPLDHELEDGDIVKINTGKEANPNKDWLNFVKTSQAKNKIKSFFSKQDRANYINTGKEMLEKEIRRRKLSFNDVLSEKNLEKVLKDTHTTDLDDLYLSIGSLRFTAGYIIDLIFEDKKDVIDIYLGKVGNRTNIGSRAVKGDIIVAGTDDILVTIANCCKPVKGDPIIGYITKGEGIAVHKKDCPNIKNSTRLIEVEWNMNNESSYLTDLVIKVVKGKNQLLNIITKASQRDVYIESVKTYEDEDYTTYAVTVKTISVDQLEGFISEIKSLPTVVEVGRTHK
ncbi:MAG TPA: bifunctional (p)ppGpp synthetase/guanosine-3',5'-bis(diphosphate) 3'-pyrophosphohydrolase [Candidatus Coprovivens excrementavium]|nr:bifunctional (p)ppGpp synthetase/guanosine-3',5'-bis(diphosphate) 3'-pyrophosphohydrolase [Candidatus Coprovivens excrementavium]